MYARKGDRIVIRNPHPDGPIRDAEVLEVEHQDGSPPYRVRWSDTGQETFIYPASDAYVDRDVPSYPAEYEADTVSI